MPESQTKFVTSYCGRRLGLRSLASSALAARRGPYPNPTALQVAPNRIMFMHHKKMNLKIEIFVLLGPEFGVTALQYWLGLSFDSGSFGLLQFLRKLYFAPLKPRALFHIASVSFRSLSSSSVWELAHCYFSGVLGVSLQSAKVNQKSQLSKSFIIENLSFFNILRRDIVKEISLEISHWLAGWL